MGTTACSLTHARSLSHTHTKCEGTQPHWAWPPGCAAPLRPVPSPCGQVRLVQALPRDFQLRTLGLVGAHWAVSHASAQAWVGTDLLRSPGLRGRERVRLSDHKGEAVLAKKQQTPTGNSSSKLPLWEKQVNILGELCLRYPNFTCSYLGKGQ